MDGTMQAVVLTAPGEMQARRLAVPGVGPDELRIKVVATGICGSDLAVYRGTHPYKSPPIVLGHELAGVVEEVGSAVTRFRPGNRVCAASFSHCERCSACQRGEVHLCADKTTLNHAGWDGSFAEYVVLKENMTFGLPSHVGWLVGALVEPLSIGLHAVRIAERHGGRTMAILGSGNIGLSCLVAARALGFRVVCVDIRESAGEAARALGAEAFIDASRRSPAAAVEEALGGERADAVVVATDYRGVAEDAAAMAARGGLIVLVSYFHGPKTVPLNAMVGNELAIVGSALSSSRDIEDVIGWLDEGAIDPRPIVAHTPSLKEAALAMREMDEATARVGKTVIRVDPALAGAPGG